MMGTGSLAKFLDMSPRPLQSCNDIAVLIIAGGTSARMGYPKPYLPFQDRTLIEYIIDTYQEICGDIYVVLNHALAGGEWKKNVQNIEKNAVIILNKHPEAGKFHSIKMGLKQVESLYCFIQNTDNPVSRETILKLAENRNPDGYTVPVFQGRGGHPVLVSRDIMDGVIKAGNETQWKEFLAAFSRVNVELSDPEVLLNINTPADYQKLTGKPIVI
jgi:molybdenum cofactor cytidylyltransferase